MIKSMTGYGRAEANIDGSKITIELRSVNHRYHEIMFKMPKDFLILEDQMKKTIQSFMKRGRIDLFLTIDTEENPNQQIQVDWNLFDQYIEVFKEIKERSQLDGKLIMQDILAVPDLIHVGQERLNIEEVGSHIISTVDIACRNLIEMRGREGEALYQDLTSRIKILEEHLIQLKARAPVVVQEYRNKLLARIQEWIDGVVEIDEARVINEVAFFTDKANIDEELTRLQSHFQQFLSILEQEEPVGRKLDFLIQEINREVNTIGSKANDLLLSQAVVEMKSELEKMREQVQNVE